MQTRLTLYCGGLSCLLLMAACGGGGGDEDDGGGPPIPVTTTQYQVVFTPEQVIGGLPAPDTITASASLSTAQGEDITASGTVTVTGTNATAVTINAGYAGENGPVAVSLGASGGSWSVPAGTELDTADLSRLQATGYYVSIETPDGMLRGQILPPGWSVGVFDLDAGSVVPAATSAGSAKAGFAINSATGAIRARITVSGIGDAISAGIRNAIPGARGNVVVALEQSMSDADVWGTRDINDVNADDLLTATGVTLLGRGQLYFSLETATHTDGELRGQIVGSAHDIFNSTLTPFEVVTSGPPVVSNAEGVATATWIDVASVLAVAVNTDITNAVSVYVQQGAFGENGTVLFSLTPDVTLPGNWVLPFAELSADQVTAFEAGEFYVSIVTAQYADGELRGQLDPLADDMTAVRTIGENGGLLSISDDGGTTYTLTVSPDALVDETVTMSMSLATAPIPMPAGLEAITAVRFEPAGTAFADYPVLDIDGILPAGPKIAFVANDDGTIIDYRPLFGDDAVAASLATAGASFDVPHFSIGGVAGVDPACDVPDVVSSGSPEAVATNAILRHVAMAACSQFAGGELQVDPALIEQLLTPWRDDLVGRTESATAQQLKPFGELLAESLRFVSLAQYGGVDVAVDDFDAIRNLGVVFADRLRSFDTACMGGEVERTDDFLRWIGKAYRAFNAFAPDSWTPPVIACLVTARVTPEGAQAVVVDAPPVLFQPVVTGADGRDLSLFSVLALGWETTMGLSEADGNFLEMDTSTIGLRESQLISSFFEFAEPVYARGIVVYDHTGVRQLSADGSASGCSDPEDDGSRVFLLEVAITSQSTFATSDTSASVSFSGTGGGAELLISSLTISVEYDSNTETSLAGSASGSASFIEQGIDEETGEPYTTTGSLNLGFASVSSDLFSFLFAAGSDSDGCTLNGVVQLGGVL